MDNIDYEAIEDYFINEREDDKKGHRIIGGENSILLTAPHSVTHIREGRIKAGEFRTGLITKLLGELSNCHIGYKTKNLGDDANYDPDCSFKKDIVNYIKDNNIKLLLDFHISKPERDYSIDIGTGRGKNIKGRNDLLTYIKEGFELKYKDVKIDHTFPAAYAHTVSSTVSREGDIPAFQIEINWKIIEDYNKMNEFIDTILKIIHILEAII